MRISNTGPLEKIKKMTIDDEVEGIYDDLEECKVILEPCETEIIRDMSKEDYNKIKAVRSSDCKLIAFDDLEGLFIKREISKDALLFGDCLDRYFLNNPFIEGSSKKKHSIESLCKEISPRKGVDAQKCKLFIKCCKALERDTHFNKMLDTYEKEVVIVYYDPLLKMRMKVRMDLFNQKKGFCDLKTTADAAQRYLVNSQLEDVNDSGIDYEKMNVVKAHKSFYSKRTDMQLAQYADAFTEATGIKHPKVTLLTVAKSPPYHTQFIEVFNKKNPEIYIKGKFGSQYDGEISRSIGYVAAAVTIRNVIKGGKKIKSYNSLLSMTT